MTSGATDPELHRQITEVLVGDFERTNAPKPREDVSGRVFACVWGLYAQIYRHARAALVLTDTGMAQECHVLVRVALEHTILLHWVAERGDAGVDAMLNTQSQNVNRSIRTMRTAELIMPQEVEEEIQRVASDVPEGEVIGRFRKICEQLGILDLYALYGVESVFVHPSIPTINAYCDKRRILQTTPQDDTHRGNFALLAPCLIWAGRDLDSLLEGQPAAEGLRRLATIIGCEPTLPHYPA